MKLLITGGSLEATIQGNPLENIQRQLFQAIKGQDEINDTISEIDIDSIKKEIETFRKELQEEFDGMLKQVSNRDNKSIKILGEKISKLSNRLNELSNRPPKTISKIINKVVNRTIVKQEPVKVIRRTVNNTIVKKVMEKSDDEMGILHSTIAKIKRTPLSRYPKGEFKVRQSIMQADKPVHSSDSNMQDKLGAVPRMPI